MTMSTSLRLSESSQALLRCPICHSRLSLVGNQFHCTGEHCQARFPIVDGVPILLNEARSVFSIDDFVRHRATTFRSTARIERWLARVVPELGVNLKAKQNYERLTRLLLQRTSHPRVLVIGAMTVGRGMASMLAEPAIEFIETDVALGERTMLVADGHDLPFEDGSFDGVVIQAVLEHVVDPSRCVEEIHRVMADGGLVYAETPFMQQVHGGEYDFTRFTYLGHRRLFRGFSEIASGAVCGPGMALAWSVQYFLLSFVNSSLWRLGIKALTRLTLFWLKYFDYYLIDKPGALDAASGMYFLGARSQHVLSDRELIGLYRGSGDILPLDTAAQQVLVPS